MVISNSFRYPSSSIKHEQRNVRAILNKKDLGSGTLFVSERYVFSLVLKVLIKGFCIVFSTLCWQEKDSIGFCVPYQNISLHAISKDESVYPGECVYIMLDTLLYMPGMCFWGLVKKKTCTLT